MVFNLARLAKRGGEIASRVNYAPENRHQVYPISDGRDRLA